MPSESSWHPAFMPNSTAETSPITPTNIQQSALAEPDPLLQKSNPTSITQLSNLQSPETGADNAPDHDVEGLVEDDTAHSELTNLRNELTTSLANPEGVELDENPLHDEIPNEDGAEEEKAGFPSEGPAPNKHLSTMSFARTVSDDVNWGEDDDVDPEWNIQRTETDPFKLMPKSDRTNSFPQVPFADALPTNFEPLHSQAEDILNEVEKEPKDLFGDDINEGEADFFAQKSSRFDEPANFLVDSTENTSTTELGSSEYIPTYGGEFPADKVSRYEEGLPLIQSPEDQETQFSTNKLAFLDDAGREEDDFFAQVSNSKIDENSEGVFPGLPSLERKSTMQVMDSLHFQPPQRTQDDILEEENIESSQSSLERSTGGGIAVSASTVLSQVFGDPAPEQPEQSGALETDSDLAAKWKAALAGDDFLEDDDELLGEDEPSAMDTAALFDSDDEGFLEDTEEPNVFSEGFSQVISPPIPRSVTDPNGQMVGFDSLTGTAHSNRPGSSSNRYIPSGPTTTAPAPSNHYAPSGPLLTDLSRSVTSPAMPTQASPAMGSYPVLQQQQRPELPKAQSFADKSKGGYASPYDLPMEVVKPRKRPSTLQLSHGYNTTPANVPPPRTNSLNSLPQPPSRGSTSSLSPPSTSQSFQSSQLPPRAVTNTMQPPKTVRKSTSGFFEDLPMSSRPKPAPRPSSSLSTPVLGQFSPQLSTQPQFTGPPAQTPYTPPVRQQGFQPPPGQGLVAPERVSPFAQLSTTAAAVPVRTPPTKYSPAPPPQQSLNSAPSQAAPSRYSPAPPNSRPSLPSYATAPGNPAPPPILAHQPRTSSPLAHFEKSQDQRSYASQIETVGFDRRSSSSTYDSTLRPNHLPPTREVDESDVQSDIQRHDEIQMQPPPQSTAGASLGTQPISSTPPPPQGLPSRMGNSPPKRVTSNYLLQNPVTSGPPSFMPPQRSQTQSPGAFHAGPKLEMSTSHGYQRPASVEMPSSPRTNTGFSSAPSAISRPRGFSQGLNYIAPIDGREKDPMQRWRGAPVFVWGVGGIIVTSFPTDVPRYGMNQTAPMILRSPGVVKVRNIKNTDPLEEKLTSFPGPLKGKSKKKEVLSWLTSGIELLEQSGAYLRSRSNLSHEDKRTEERILLWKILRLFIENDGTLEGTPTVEKAVRAVLSPGVDDDITGTTPLYATGAELTGISHTSTSMVKADPVDPAAVDQLRKLLLRGEREKAVWEAVDKRLWAHAMLISNTVSKDLYKQVAQEFVQKEVKNIGDNVESLAALYEIFAGNFEESVDELVPPRLAQAFKWWRETLGLVLSNRSPDDSQALNALGKLLAGYGRAEAAHICFLFARSYSVFGGIDDPQASIVLVGSDHLRQPYEFDKELEPILLSEVFEYGMSLSSASKTSSTSPHLSVYKLQHAAILAEYGYREKALQYCEAIASSITSQTRRSPYHHAFLISALDDLSKRLKQSPKDESTSWISKPSIDKVSGSVWSTFNKFVAGDEHESLGPGSANGSANDVGLFSRIAGGTPTISRSPSNSDLYGSYNGAININGAPAGTKTGSRYAPGAMYTPPAQDLQMGTSFGSQSRGSFEGRSSGEHRRGHYDPHQQSSDYRPDSQHSTNNFIPQASSGFTPQQSSTSYGIESPYAEISSPYTPQLSTPFTEQPPNTMYSSPQAINESHSQQPASSYTASEPSYAPHSSGYEPPSNGGYEPPTSSGPEPLSYQPSNLNEELDSPISTRPKNNSFIDDDGDDRPAPRTANSAEKSKAEKDREADEAFRKAAEADAAKAASGQPAKKGWGLGGWFGGGAKKEPDISQPNKPIRAKLGEASSFVYDPDLKRWVNKKGGAENTPSPSATPPPPRAAGPPRSVSGPPGAPSGFTSAPRLGGPPQRVVSGSSDMDGTSTEISGSAPPPLGGGGLGAPPPMSRSASNGSAGPSAGPPSRPGTSMSNASSIDDLLGPPTAAGRKVAGKKAKKGRGYVDVMSEKAAGP
ncbi:transport sec16 [Hyphodiscus hymeniophilus]|uniref:Protein transport protein sec16 n=1 Tax=Hyphodiscus hymeniophilus TaxID=353542 RepID=A0A9P6VIW7_9HELO|nr:transport sec16 [Hyphodiscus hymeniophilus]